MLCALCRGTGLVSEQTGEWLQIGTVHRLARVRREESIRECAQRLGLTASQLSGMEHGRADPSSLPVPEDEP